MTVTYLGIPPVNELTESQDNVYKALIEMFIDNQIMPTKKELADKLGFNPNSIQGTLNILERKGYIDIDKGKSRSIRFTRLKIQLVAA